MERRDFLEKFGMGAAVMGTLAAAPQAAMPAGVSDTANRNSFRAADFGAVGNGSADDTAAIQRAVDAAHNLGGGTVYLEETPEEILSALARSRSITSEGCG